MSDGSGLMRDGTDAPALWAPPWEGVEKTGARFVLVMLCRWADGRGCVPATMEEMAGRLGIGLSTLRDYFAILMREQLVSRPAQGRMADGTMSPLRHWLNLEKLGNADHHRQNSAPVAGAAVGVDNPVDEPPPELSAGGSTGAETQHTGAESQQPPPELSAGESAGIITTGAHVGACARAEFPLPSNSYFLSFAWPDEDTKAKAARILSACGPQLGKLGDQNNRVLLSLAYVLDGLWDGFDFERDVLPVIPRKTGPGRKGALWDFALITENIEAHRAKRLKDEARVAEREAKRLASGDGAKAAAAKSGGGRGGFAGFGSGSADAGLKRRERMRTLRRLLADFGAGDRTMTFELAPKDRGLSGEWLEDAFRPVVAGWTAELERLVAEDGADGGGDGEG